MLYRIGEVNDSLLRVELRGVRVEVRVTAVFQSFCAGLGVILTKSAKSKAWLGVLGNKFPPPGVIIMDDGKSNLPLLGVLGGGVEGGSMRVRVERTAGDGEAAR